MRKILFIAAMAAVAMTSCSKNEVIENTSPQNAISFVTAVGKVKANETNATTIQSGVNLYGYYTAGAFGAEVPQKYFSNPDKLSCTAGVWNTTGTYYWPVSGKLSVFAAYPATLTVTEPAAAGAYPSFAYTVKAGIDSQEDIVVANAMDQVKATPTATAVKLQFKHILSQVNFYVALTGDTYRVKVESLKIAGAKDQATFTFDGTTGTWGTATGAAEYVFAAAATDFISAATKIGASAMLMPQAAAARTFAIEVKYTVYHKTLDGVALSSTITKTVDMQQLDLGKKYKYTLTLPAEGVEKITFDVDASDWDNETPVPVTPAI